jgi:selenocysteine lyase/cysteine desulfurase
VKGNWSDRVLEAIDERTAAVAIAQLHWVDGTMFDLRAIRGRTNEENWIKRAGSEDFRKLVNYRDDYRPLAGRYSVGEHSNFLMAPMQVAALKQVNDWTPELVQTYCKGLWDSTGSVFDRAGIEIPGDRAYHLIGLTLPGHIDQEKLSAEIERRGLTVSYRGDAVRVSPNVYNTEEELVSLGEALLASVI